MHDLPQILRNNANWLRERGTFPKAAQACDDAAKEIERLRAKETFADEASELLYNFATGKDDGAAIIAHVKAKLETI